MQLPKHDLRTLASRIESSVERIGLNMAGQNVLTEAASGPFAATPILAALAGANHVAAVTRPSRWGTVEEIRSRTLELAAHFGVTSAVEVCVCDAASVAAGADVVTNLGFVRPISRALVEQLPAHAAIALMWEPWEFRPEDIDMQACDTLGIPVIATNERHAHVGTLHFVGLLAVKLLFEHECEVSGLNVIVVGSNPFGSACETVLTSLGAEVTWLDPLNEWPPSRGSDLFRRADAVVIVEHRYKGTLLDERTDFLLKILGAKGTPVIHICGGLSDSSLLAYGIQKHPPNPVPIGYMSVTTAHVGSKPVVDLHCAGLHVASMVSRARKNGASIEAAIEIAIASGYGLPLDIVRHGHAGIPKLDI